MPAGGDYVPCYSCKSSYHFECAGLKERTHRAKTQETKEKWRCPHNCRGLNANLTPTNENPVQISPIDDINPSLADVMRYLKQMDEKLNDFKQSVEFMSQKYDQFLVDFEKERKANKEQKTEVVKLREESKLLYKQNEEISDRLNHLDQYHRNKNLETHGLPQRDNEDVDQILLDMAVLLKLPLKIEDIEAAHRLKQPKNKKPPPIIVQFASRRLRNMWIKKRTGITCKNVIKNGSDTPIYFNENLTPINKQLFWQARKLAKEKNLKYCWIKDGKILVKKNDES